MCQVIHSAQARYTAYTTTRGQPPAAIIEHGLLHSGLFHIVNATNHLLLFPIVDDAERLSGAQQGLDPLDVLLPPNHPPSRPGHRYFEELLTASNPSSVPGFSGALLPDIDLPPFLGPPSVSGHRQAVTVLAFMLQQCSCLVLQPRASACLHVVKALLVLT